MKNTLVILLLILPTFGLLLQSGIHTMHDPHVFRQYEFHQCAIEKIVPCRWAMNSGLGYGEPIFSFYGQLPYWVGELGVFLSGEILGGVKFAFIMSLVLSAWSMYAFSSRLLDRKSAMIASILYTYAPYRAVDVWVRGALPEALGFVFFPLILYYVDSIKNSKKTSHVLLLAMLIAGLILTHNLSAIMFLPFAGLWYLLRLDKPRDFFAIPKYVISAILGLLLASFYILPVIFESKLVTLTDTVKGYFEYQLHYVSIKQLFISRFWGYGGSVWGPNDTMSFSVGHVHWVAISILAIIFVRRLEKNAAISLVLGTFALLLTHGRSEIIWKSIPGMEYIQFPWRFLTVAIFFLSLTVGLLVKKSPRWLIPVIMVIAIGYSGSLFKPDIWQKITDEQVSSGRLWDEGRSSSLNDYWPKYGMTVPTTFAPDNPIALSGEVITGSTYKSANSAGYTLIVNSKAAEVALPIVFFPGWLIDINGQPVTINPDKQLGRISFPLTYGEYRISAVFTDSKIRMLANITTIVSFSAIIIYWIIYAIKNRRSYH